MKSLKTGTFRANNCPDIGIEIVILDQHSEELLLLLRHVVLLGPADNMMEGDQVLEHRPRLLSP